MRYRVDRSATSGPNRSRNRSVVENVTAPESGSDAGLGDQPARHQGPDHCVDVDAAHRAHPRPRHRLAVGHHGERLQCGPSQLRSGAVEQQPLDIRARTASGCTSANRPPASRRSMPLSRCGQLVGDQPAAWPQIRYDGLFGHRGQCRRLLTGVSTTSSSASSTRAQLVVVELRGRWRRRCRGSHPARPQMGRTFGVAVATHRCLREIDLQFGIVGIDAAKVRDRSSQVSHVLIGRRIYLPAIRRLAGRHLRSTKPGAHQVVLTCSNATARDPIQFEQRQEAADDLDRHPDSRRPAPRTTPTPRFRGPAETDSSRLACSGTDTCEACMMGRGRRSAPAAA